MTIHTIAADLADRIPEMARDSKLNNAEFMERLLREAGVASDQTGRWKRDVERLAEWRSMADWLYRAFDWHAREHKDHAMMEADVLKAYRRLKQEEMR